MLKDWKQKDLRALFCCLCRSQRDYTGRGSSFLSRVLANTHQSVFSWKLRTWVYLFLRSDFEEHLCNFWLENNFENFLGFSKAYWPKDCRICLRHCVCSRSPFCQAVRYIKLDILSRDIADFPLHQILLYMSYVQKLYGHLQKIFFTLTKWCAMGWCILWSARSSIR